MGSLSRYLLSDRFRLQFRAQAFNVLNCSNLQLGETDIGNLNNPQFAQAGGTFSPRKVRCEVPVCRHVLRLDSDSRSGRLVGVALA